MLEKNIRIVPVASVGKAGRTAAIGGGDAGSTAAVAPLAHPAANRAPAAAPAQSDVLAMATAIASQAPPIDTARVSALRDLIASGEYNINVAATALAIASALGDDGAR